MEETVNFFVNYGINKYTPTNGREKNNSRTNSFGYTASTDDLDVL